MGSEPGHPSVLATATDDDDDGEEEDDDNEGEPSVNEIAMVPLADMLNANPQLNNVCYFISNGNSRPDCSRLGMVGR